MVNNNNNNSTNRVSGSSFMSDEEFVVIRLGGQNMSKPVHTMTTVVSGCTASPPIHTASTSEVSYKASIEPENDTQIRRITMKKESTGSTGSNIGGPSVSSRRKKDSIASIIIDTKDSLNTPLIIQTQSVESLSETDETPSRPPSITPSIKYSGANTLAPLSHTDLPRHLRSTRRLSVCNEQIMMELQQKMHNPSSNPDGSSSKRNSSRRSSRRSSSIIENVKAVSCDAGIVTAKNNLPGSINDSQLLTATTGKKTMISGHSQNQVKSMPILTEKIEKCDSTESCSSKPVWGQFHFFPGENQLTSGQKQLTSGSISEMNSKMVKQSNPYVSTSFTTTTIGTNAEVASSFYSAPQCSSNNVVQHPKQLPIVLMPSSYDLAAKNHPDEEGCVNIILVCGSLVLLGTISAIVALIFGLI